MAGLENSTVPGTRPTFYDRAAVDVCYVNRIKHYFNPLHHYSRLIKSGVSKEKARERTTEYEAKFNVFDKKVLDRLLGFELCVRDFFGDEKSW